MKKSPFLATMLLFAIVSCTKNEQSSFINEDAQVQKLLKAGDSQAQVQIYNLMQPAVRRKLWVHHLGNAKKQFVQSGEWSKVKLIDELLKQMSVDVFKTDSRQQTVFLHYFLPQWTKAAREMFSDLGFYDLVGNPGQSLIRSSSAKDTPIATGEVASLVSPDYNGEDDGSVPKCFCHLNQLGYACSVSETTVTVSSIGVISYSYKYKEGRCEKKPAECRETLLGCGTLWLASCDGNGCVFA